MFRKWIMSRQYDAKGMVLPAVLMEWSRELLETCTKVVNENRVALTEAQDAIQDPNCPPCDG